MYIILYPCTSFYIILYPCTSFYISVPNSVPPYIKSINKIITRNQKNMNSSMDNLSFDFNPYNNVMKITILTSK